MKSNRQIARLAGVLYLIVAITGAFSILYVPQTLIVPEDSSATIRNILGSEMLFRGGIVSGLVCQITFLLLALALYRLFERVNRNHAAAMLILVVASVPIAFLTALSQMAALILAKEGAAMETLAMVSLELRQQGLAAVSLFWGLWLFPFGVLVYKSRFLPRTLGILLIVSCFAYLLSAFTALFFPPWAGSVERFTAVPAGLGEFAAMLWLVIRGAKENAAGVTARAA